MVDEHKCIMDSNMKMQTKARKLSLIVPALFLVVFVLGLKIEIVVYRARRFRNLESQTQSHQSIRKLEYKNDQSFSEIERRLKKLERTKITIIDKGRGLKKKRQAIFWSFTIPSARVLKKPNCIYHDVAPWCNKWIQWIGMDSFLVG